MRFDKPIYFQHITSGAYDESSGNYFDDTVSEIKRYASITQSGIETLNLIYGKLQQDSLTVRIQQHYDKPFDYIRIGNKRYRVDFKRDLSRFSVFVISEVQGHET